MADRRITQLSQITNPSTNAVLPVVNSNVTLKVTVDDLVKASSWGNHRINDLTQAVAPDGEIDPTLQQVAIQTTTNTTPPQKIALATFYPRPLNTSTISFAFNQNTRVLQASLNNNSLQPFHFSTGCVQASAIANGAITEAKIDPNAKIRGATGGGTDRVFYENDQTISTNYTITSGKNAMTAGPITINSGVTVTVPDGSTWTVV